MLKEEQIELIKQEDDLINKAMIIIKELFKDKKDKGNMPYINHLLFVMNYVDTYEEKVVGLLHDTVEDTDLTFDDLQKLGFTDEIIVSLKLLTHSKEIPYDNYIDTLLKSNNLTAIRVKKADMTHNLNPDRLASLEPKQSSKLLKKYQGPYQKINKYLEGK